MGCGADYFSCKCQDSTNNTYTCLRTIIQEEEEDSIFCLFEDDESFVEIYDLNLDPYQLTNLVPVEEEELSKKMQLMSQLKSCKGWRERLSGDQSHKPHVNKT